MLTAGDFQLQLHIGEVFYRLCAKAEYSEEQYKEMFAHFPNVANTVAKFACIDGLKDFVHGMRQFVLFVNESMATSRRYV